VPLCPPQIPHDLTRAGTRATAVGSRRLSVWAMTRPILPPIGLLWKSVLAYTLFAPNMNWTHGGRMWVRVVCPKHELNSRWEDLSARCLRQIWTELTVGRCMRCLHQIWTELTVGRCVRCLHQTWTELTVGSCMRCLHQTWTELTVEDVCVVCTKHELNSRWEVVCVVYTKHELNWRWKVYALFAPNMNWTDGGRCMRCLHQTWTELTVGRCVRCLHQTWTELTVEDVSAPCLHQTWTKLMVERSYDHAPVLL
jgi:hypothetical protein